MISMVLKWVRENPITDIYLGTEYQKKRAASEKVKENRELEASSFWMFDSFFLWLMLMAVFGADRTEVQGYLSISAVLQEGGHNFIVCFEDTSCARRWLHLWIQSSMIRESYMRRYFALKSLDVLGKRHNRMMLNIISGGRSLVWKLLVLNQIQRLYVLAAKGHVFLYNFLHLVWRSM